MSASPLNLSAMTAPGQAAGTAPTGGAGAAKGALAGFEALMAAFFGAQGEGQVADPAAQLAGGQPVAQAGDAATAAAAAAAAASKDGKTGKPGEDAAKVDDSAKTDAAAATDANLALIAALAGQPAPGAQADVTKAKGEAAEGGKPAATPGAPIPPQAQAGAELFQKAVAAADAEKPDAAAPAQTPGTAPQAPDAAKALARAAEAAPSTPAPAPAVTSAKPAVPAEAPAPQPAVQAAAEPVSAAPAPAVQAALPAVAANEAPVAPAPVKEKAAPRSETDGKPAARTEAFAAAPAHHGPQAVAAAGANRPDGRNDNAATGEAAAHAVEAAAVETEAAHEPAQPAAQAPQAEASVAAPALAHAQPPVVRGSPETVANLAAQILKKLDGRSTRFNVELTPAGLGRVDVSVEINAHGRISTSMAFDNPQAAADVKARSADLQQALEQAGFDMSGGMNFDVAGQQNRQGQGFAGSDGGQGERSFRGRAFQAALDTADEADSQAGSLNLRRGLRSAVDVRI